MDLGRLRRSRGCRRGLIGCLHCLHLPLAETDPALGNAWVLPNYLALAAMTGALWLAALGALFGIDRPAIRFGSLQP